MSEKNVWYRKVDVFLNPEEAVCPKHRSRLVYRLGENGELLLKCTWKDCDYTMVPIDSLNSCPLCGQELKKEG